MIALQIARLIANFVLSLEYADDETIDANEVVQVFKILRADLKALDKDSLRELLDAFAVVALEYPGKYQQSVHDLPHDLFLEEAMAADNPARLAELDSCLDADDRRYLKRNDAEDDVLSSAPPVEEPIHSAEQPTAWQRLRSRHRSM